MSITGEILHGMFADDLADVMIAAVEDPKFNGCRNCVKGFAKEILFPLYKAHKKDTYGTTSTEKDLKIKEYFGEY